MELFCIAFIFAWHPHHSKPGLLLLGGSFWPYSLSKGKGKNQKKTCLFRVYFVFFHVFCGSARVPIFF